MGLIKFFFLSRILYSWYKNLTVSAQTAGNVWLSHVSDAKIDDWVQMVTTLHIVKFSIIL